MATHKWLIKFLTNIGYSLEHCYKKDFLTNIRYSLGHFYKKKKSCEYKKTVLANIIFFCLDIA